MGFTNAPQSVRGIDARESSPYVKQFVVIEVVRAQLEDKDDDYQA
jgi:hypothetical protein